MRDATFDTYFETTHHGVRTRRSQHQVTYELPSRPLSPFTGAAVFLAMAGSATLWLGSLSVTNIVLTLLLLLVDLARRTTKTRIILTPERLAMHFQYPWRKSFTCGWDVDEIRSLARQPFPVNGRLLSPRSGSGVLVYAWQRGAAEQYLWSEISTWHANAVAVNNKEDPAD